MEAMRTVVCRRPVWIVAIWLAVAIVVGCLSPDLTKLAAEGQAKMVAGDAESRRAAELVKQAGPTRLTRRWPLRFCIDPKD